MNQAQLMQLILAPRVTEKATQLGEKQNQFVFKVLKTASKPRIKQAIELLFKVEVEAVQICKVPSKRKRYKQIPGQRPAWKKAYVKLKPGFNIDYMGA